MSYANQLRLLLHIIDRLFSGEYPQTQTSNHRDEMSDAANLVERVLPGSSTYAWC